MSVRRRVCGLVVVLSLFAAVGVAQDKKREAQLRTVRGVVADKSDNPLSGSVVFLKNVRTNSVRSSYTDDTGNYRFSDPALRNINTFLLAYFVARVVFYFVGQRLTRAQQVAADLASHG